ncbi:MAG: D-alanine--D-alanine ligase family protein [Gammaproteobacteria bacterium]
MRIGITYDLREEYLAAGYGEEETAEFDRPDTIHAIAGALHALGYRPERIGNVKQLAQRLVAGERWDLVFNIAEGLHGYGREAQVPALLDAYQIPYTFSDPLVCALTLHKAMAKRIVRDSGLATAPFAVVDSEREVENVRLPFPLFAKPLAEGTGKGVDGASKAESGRQLRAVCKRLLARYGQPVLVEQYLPGREFTVAILGTGQDAVVLGTAEITLRDGAEPDAYSFYNKEYCEQVVRYRLADDPDLRAEVQALALSTWRCLGCRDAGRVDIRLDAQGVPHFLEVNPLAGLHPEHSDVPIIATLVGVSYPQLIRLIIESALKRCPTITAQVA